MKEELLKSVANTNQIFNAPFMLAVFNLLIGICFIILLLLLGVGVYIWVPIVSILLVHMALIGIGKKEPHIDSIIIARNNIKAKTKNIIKERGNKFAP